MAIGSIIATAGTEALKNGGSVELAKIGASGEEMFKAGIGTAADFAGEKIAQSCSDDMLAQFVIQTTFSFGVQKGTDKAAKSFGKGFSNKMSKYVGKAGATSTKGSPKIGDANVDMPETLKVKEPEVHSESPMFGEDWNSYFKEKYGEGNVTWESAPKKIIYNGPYVRNGKQYGRPGPRGKEKLLFEQAVYDAQVGDDGILREPYPPYRVIDWKPGQPRKGVVDFGHKVGKDYDSMFKKYVSGEITLIQLKEFQCNPDNFRIEIPSSNRDHSHE